MATKNIQYDSFKRGDTPVFAYVFNAPYTGFSWSGLTFDVALTSVADPLDNTGAAMSRIGQTLTINADGSASGSVQLLQTESKALSPGVKYKLEAQIKDTTGSNVATAASGTVLVEQDYVI